MKKEQLLHTNLFNEVSSEPDDWFNYLRMNKNTYIELM
jgi:hypothetical protein